MTFEEEFLLKTGIMFNDFYKKNHQTFVYLLYSFTKDNNVSENIVQDSYILLMKYFHIYNPEKSSITTYFNRILYNALKKNYKIDKRIETQPMEYFFNEPIIHEEDEIDHTKKYNDVMKFINMMEDKYRIPFLMSFDDYSYVEISQKLGVKIQSVKNYIYYARTLVRNEFGFCKVKKSLYIPVIIKDDSQLTESQIRKKKLEKEYKERNKEKLKEYHRQYRESHKKYYNEYNRKYIRKRNY